MNRTAKYPEIVLSEEICRKIKDKYFPNAPYSTVVNKIGLKFSDLKKAAKEIFAGSTEIEYLQKLNKFSMSDFEEFLEVAEIFLKNAPRAKKETSEGHHVSQKIKLNGGL